MLRAQKKQRSGEYLPSLKNNLTLTSIKKKLAIGIVAGAILLSKPFHILEGAILVVK